MNIPRPHSILLIMRPQVGQAYGKRVLLRHDMADQASP